MSRYVIQGTIRQNFLAKLDVIPEWDEDISKAMKFESIGQYQRWRHRLSPPEQMFLKNSQLIPIN